MIFACYMFLRVYFARIWVGSSHRIFVFTIDAVACHSCSCVVSQFKPIPCLISGQLMHFLIGIAHDSEAK